MEINQLSGVSQKSLEFLANLHNFNSSAHDLETFNRTFCGRHNDTIIFLKYLFGQIIASKQDHNKIFSDLNSQLFSPLGKSLFFDIGAGLGFRDEKFYNGKGQPGITSQEIAKHFPNMEVIAMDLPNSIELFMGVGGKNYCIPVQARKEFLRYKNLHIIEGNGLESILEQYLNEHTNPLKLKQRPVIDLFDTIMIRVCNSIEIYNSMEKVIPALDLMLIDFFKWPTLLFVNKLIWFKKSFSKEIIEIGEVSQMGFNHKNRIRTRHGADPFIFYNQVNQTNLLYG